MARPQRRNVDYFPHYISHGMKMQYIQNKFGNDGYATWFKIMEKLGSSNDHHIDLSDDLQFELFADYCLIDIEKLDATKSNLIIEQRKITTQLKDDKEYKEQLRPMYMDYHKKLSEIDEEKIQEDYEKAVGLIMELEKQI